MDSTTPAPERAQLHAQLAKAAETRLGVPPALEQHVRDYARAARLAGMPVQRMLVDLKGAVRSITGDQECVFMPRVVGWAVAGFFAGMVPEERDER